MEKQDPFELFRDWYDQACGSSIALPGATCLSTLGSDGSPAARTVLLSSFDVREFVFRTNYENRKGEELAACPRAARRLYP